MAKFKSGTLEKIDRSDNSIMFKGSGEKFFAAERTVPFLKDDFLGKLISIRQPLEGQPVFDWIGLSKINVKEVPARVSDGFKRSGDSQVQIVRQNSLTQANNLLNTMYGRGDCPTSDKMEEKLFEIARKCEEWVMRQ